MKHKKIIGVELKDEVDESWLDWKPITNHSVIWIHLWIQWRKQSTIPSTSIQLNQTIHEINKINSIHLLVGFTGVDFIKYYNSMLKRKELINSERVL